MQTLHSSHADADAFRFSPLVLADRLLVLAHEADRAGYAAAADRIVRLAFTVYDEKGRQA